MTTTINADNGVVSGSAGLKSSADSTGVLALQTNGTTAVTVDTSQNVGIGTASPATYGKLAVAGTSNFGVDQTDYIAAIGGGGTGRVETVGGNTSINLALSTKGTGSTYFWRGGYGGTQMALINQYGIGLGATTPSSGTGITFPATESASTDANTLDDYEEGTWTPAFAFGGNSVGTTYASRFGKYTKIGNVVVISGYIGLSAKGSSTGGVTITGIPFSPESFGAISFGQLYSYTYTSGNQVYGYTGSSVITLQFTTPAGALSNVDSTNFTNTTTTIFSAVFRI
jgi:hypothetical protein